MDEHETWASFFQKLQEYRNQELQDQSANAHFQTTSFDQEIKQKTAKTVLPTTNVNPRNKPRRQSVRQNHDSTNRYTLRNLPVRQQWSRANTQQVPRNAIPPTPPNSQPMSSVPAQRTFETILGLSPNPYPCNCYSCGRYGHKQHDCPIGAFLDLNNLRLKQVGGNVSEVPKKTTSEIWQRQEQRWGPWLRGNNPLRKIFGSLNDFNGVLRQAGEPTVQEPFKRVGNLQRPLNNMRYCTKEQRMSGNPWPPITLQLNALANEFDQSLNY